MYYNGNLSIDPSQATSIEKVPPTKAFKKFLHAITAGAISDKEENETFTAISILQQFNIALKNMGIDNIVRISKDDYDFYLDQEGKQGDLKEAMESFELKVDKIESEVFNKLELLLEHEDTYFKYLIQININRVHKLNEYPIELKVNGLLRKFQGSDQAKLKKDMESVFSTQKKYENFLNTNKQAFNDFLEKLEQAIQKFIKTDDIINQSNVKIIRPKEPITTKNQIKHTGRVEPIYYGYYGIDNYFFYSWLWSDMCYSHNIHCADMHLMDESGALVMEVGGAGFDAGDSNALNTAEDFETPNSNDIQYHDDNDFATEIENSGNSISHDGATSDNASFFDFSSSSDSSDFSSSCSSSCSSCGGGGCGGD